ncbi:MAG: aminopeptidase [Gemmatimonadota bacterium]
MTTTRRLALLTLAALGGLSLACSPGYVLRAGWEEAKILQSRRSIHEVVHDTATDARVRANLRLVADAREYARVALGLEPKRSFESYAVVAHDTLQLVVSAAPEFQLTWKTWWFPIVGHVPYKGYFEFDDAFREAEGLAEDGYDTWVRPTSAFSTLGWLPDPVLSTTIEADSARIVETVIHEIVHTTYFPRGYTQFSESFANFVGYRGAIQFFCQDAALPGECQAIENRWADVQALGRFYKSLFESLETLYESDSSVDEMRAGKRSILAGAALSFQEQVRPELLSGWYADLDPAALNNAWLLSRILYYERLEDFEAALLHVGSLEDLIQTFVTAADSDPWSVLDGLLLSSSQR